MKSTIIKHRFSFKLLLILLCFQLSSCSSNEDPNTGKTPVALAIFDLSVEDKGDNANASDIRISFKKTTREDELESYRAIVVKTDNVSAFNLNAAKTVAPTNYTRIDKTGLDIDMTLPASAVDSDGDTIEEEVSYTIFIMSVAVPSSTEYTDGLSDGAEITLAPTSPPHTVSNLNKGFSASGGIVVGADGSIYIADFGTGAENGTKILKFTPDGSNYTEFADGLLGPTGGSFNSQGDLFWSSYSASKVHKIDNEDNVTDFASVPGPVAIVIDDMDNLYVASCDANSIRKVSPSGTVSVFATSSSFNCINGLAADGEGNLYGCNFGGRSIFKIDSDGTVTTIANIPSGSADNMTFKDGDLYIVGRNTHKVYQISVTTGKVETIAGTGVRGNTNGPSLESQFSYPNGIQFNPDGTSIYVNDVDPNSDTNQNGVNFNPNILRKIELSN